MQLEFITLVASSCAPLLQLHWYLAGLLVLVGMLCLVADGNRSARWLLACSVPGEESPVPGEVAALSAELARSRAEWVAAMRRHVELQAELLVVEAEIRRVAEEAAGWAAVWSADGLSGVLVPRRVGRLWASN